MDETSVPSQFRPSPSRSINPPSVEHIPERYRIHALRRILWYRERRFPQLLREENWVSRARVIEGWRE
jgi:hypothetical protein